MDTLQDEAAVLNFITAASRIDSSKISCYHLMLTIETTQDLLNDFLLFDGDLEILDAAEVKQAVFWALTLASLMKTKCLQMSGRWEKVFQMIIRLSRNWMPQYPIDFPELVRDLLMPWILGMFSNPQLCPNPYLRLEMLRFIGMWPETYFQDGTLGQQAAAGLVNTSAYLVKDNFISWDSQISLLNHLSKVINTLHKCGHLEAVAAASLNQVKNLKIGKEAVFFHRLINLLSQMAEVPRDMYCAGHITSVQSIDEYENIFSLFELLVITPPTMAVYESPGLTQSATASLVNMTSALVAMRPKLQLEYPERFLRYLFMKVDEIFQMLRTSTPITQDLGLNFCDILAIINRRAAESGFSFNNFPTPCEHKTPLDNEECLEFVDSLTHSVMETPVLLHSSKMVVDESTLVHLLLVSPLDPFTRCPLDHGSYSRLPHLQDDINAWTKTTVHNYTSGDIARFNETVTNINNFEVIIDNTRDSDIKCSACPLHVLLSQFGFN